MALPKAHKSNVTMVTLRMVMGVLQYAKHNALKIGNARHGEPAQHTLIRINQELALI
jgi:hypothetical protein